LAITLNRPELAYAHLKGILDALAWELNVDAEIKPAESQQFAPGRAGAVWVKGRELGRIGQLHPRLAGQTKSGGEVAFLELDLQQLLAEASPRKFAGLPRFPVITRDLSIVLPQAVTWLQVKQAAQPEGISYVGEYQGPGIGRDERSLTLRLVVERPDRTPTEDEAAAAEAKLLRRLERAVGAKTRA
jgi:phenylalanyl-tRNA synthetase beta chain